MTGMNRPVSSQSASRRSRSGRRWIRPMTWNGGIEIIACSGTFGVRRSGRASIDVSATANSTAPRLTWAYSDRDARFREPYSSITASRQDEEVLVGLVEDVGDPRLAGPDLALDHEAVGVQGQRQRRGGSPPDQVEHGRRIRGACEPPTGPPGSGAPGPAVRRTTPWRLRSPAARRPAGGPRTARRPSRACRSRRPSCRAGGSRSAGTAARSPTGGGATGR